MPLDKALIDRIDPEQPSAIEREWMERISVADYSVYLTKLELVCEEAKQVLVNTSTSIASQANDCIVGIYTAAGDLALASVGTYLHVATGIVPVKYILKYFKDDPTVGVYDGDSFFANDARFGGIHNPDQLNIVPIFWEDELVAWVSAAAHIPETGAADPGGYAPFARSRFEEGLTAPPVKVAENFQVKDDVMNLLANMVRDEDMMWTDMKARTLACYRVRDRLLELIREKGVGFVQGLLRKTVQEVAQAARRVISGLPDGTFRHAVFLDVAGKEEGLRVIHLALRKKGDNLIIDLSGSSPTSLSFTNSKPHIARAQLAGDLMMFLFADFPASTAILSPLKILAPEDTFMNAPDDAAIAGNMRMIPQVVNAIHNCLSKMLYITGAHDYVTSARSVHGGIVLTGGLNQYGRPFGWIPICAINSAGNSAAMYQDGMDASVFWWSGYGDALDAEHEEVQFPYLVLYRRLALDRAGGGKYRGGTGMSEAYMLHDNPRPMELVWAPDKVGVVNTPGLFAGYYGGLTPLVVLKGLKQRMGAQGAGAFPTSLRDTVDRGGFLVEAGREPVNDGDLFVFTSGCAGGYGDILDRDPQQVTRDIRQGVVSPWAARSIFHVAFNEDTLDVDQQGTEQLRAQERRRRLAEGQPYAEFEREWLKLRPREDLLRYYGPWPWAIQ